MKRKTNDILKAAIEKFNQPKERPIHSIQDIVSANQMQYVKEGRQIGGPWDVRKFITPRVEDNEGDLGFKDLASELLP
jgi:hypothetical protein